MTSKTVSVIPQSEFSSEVERMTHFKHVVAVRQMSEDSAISFQTAPSGSQKPKQKDWALAKEALKQAESKEMLRRRLINKLAAKVESAATPKLQHNTT